MDEAAKITRVSTENLPEGEYKLYQKKVPTRALRMDGPFTVETSEGPLTCKDGYVAIDARGYPYPIAVDEFALIYEEAEDRKPATTLDLYRFILGSLIAKRDAEGRSDKARRLSVAITELETSLLWFKHSEA